MDSQLEQALIEEASGWLKGKWIHGQALKGAGADCIQLIIAIFRNVGLLPKSFKTFVYNQDWALHNNESIMLREIKKHCVEVKDKNKIEIGDILIFKAGRCESHAALYVGNDTVIHSTQRRGIERTTYPKPLIRRFASVWRLKEYV